MLPDQLKAGALRRTKKREDPALRLGCLRVVRIVINLNSDVVHHGQLPRHCERLSGQPLGRDNRDDNSCDGDTE